MIQKAKKMIAVILAVIFLVSMFCTSAVAAELSGTYASTEIPELRNVTWLPLGKVLGTDQTAKYFIIHTTAGDHTEDLYLSFPTTGGFRVQSKHETQQKVEVSNVGLFEPETVAAIDYKTDAVGNIVMVGADGTVAQYTAAGDGFTLTVLNSSKETLVAITQKQIYFAYDRTGKAVGSRVELPLAEKEAIYGGGEKFNDTNQVGHSFSLTNVDAWSLDDYSYINVPIFHSNRCYSVWFNMTYPGVADIGESNPNKYTVQFQGEKLDFFLWTGTPLENIKKYTSITGTSGVPEQWTLGFWTGAMKSAFEAPNGEGNAYAKLRELFEGYKDNYNFYPEGCHGEGTNSYTALPLNYAKTCGVRMFYWFYPATSRNDLALYLPNATSQIPVSDGKGGYTQTGFPLLFDTNILNRYNMYVFSQHNRDEQKTWWDFSNPSATEAIANRLTQYWDLGLSGAMIDYGEYLPFYGTAFNGLTGMEMHNLNAYYYAKRANEAWTKRFGNDYVLYERAGTAGSQQYAMNFLGDQKSDWEGYQKQIYAMVAMGASGYNLYGGDLGGLGGAPVNELWNRWVALSTFSPIMRQQGAVVHMPWNYGMTAKATFGDYYYLRKNLGPTLMSATIDANKNGNPIVKGMMIAYPYQLALANINNQYLFCDDFLVCAVTEENAHTLKVHLPKAEKWYSLFTNDVYKGGQSVLVEAPTTFMPVFVRNGAVKAINLPESMELMTEMHNEQDTEFSEIPALLVTPPEDARTSVIYVKDGESEDFRTYESHTETYVNAPKGDNAFTITNAEGSDREIVLAVGVTAASVSYDGTALTRLKAMPTYFTKEYGYYVDLDGKTHIFLPAGWKEITITKGDAAYESYALKPVTADAMKNMFDDDIITGYQMPTAKNSTVVFALDGNEAKTVGRMEIKWMTGFWHTYDIEYSADGENWELLLLDDEYTVTEGAGGFDILNFTPVTAKQFRITTVERGDTTPAPAIYTLNVCAPDPFTTIAEAEPEDDAWKDLEDWDDTEEENKKNKKKKVVVAHTAPSIWWTILPIGGGVLAGTGITLFIILFLKKKKKKQAEEVAETDVVSVDDVSSDFPAEL